MKTVIGLIQKVVIGHIMHKSCRSISCSKTNQTKRFGNTITIFSLNFKQSLVSMEPFLLHKIITTLTIKHLSQMVPHLHNLYVNRFPALKKQ